MGQSSSCWREQRSASALSGNTGGGPCSRNHLPAISGAACVGGRLKHFIPKCKLSSWECVCLNVVVHSFCGETEERRGSRQGTARGVHRKTLPCGTNLPCVTGGSLICWEDGGCLVTSGSSGQGREGPGPGPGGRGSGDVTGQEPTAGPKRPGEGRGRHGSRHSRCDFKKDGGKQPSSSDLESEGLISIYWYSRH